MTQGAMFAELDHQKPEIVIAMFLHDIGHLLVEDNPNMMGELGVENHETLGRKFLEDLGIPEPIPELVENHVKVKRYLVAVNPSYYQKLSEICNVLSFEDNLNLDVFMILLLHKYYTNIFITNTNIIYKSREYQLYKYMIKKK